MNRMAEPLGTNASISGDTDDETAITAVLHAETQAFMDGDYESWAECWVQNEQSQDICLSAGGGLTVISGWSDIAARMKHVLQNDLGCQMVRFRKDNLRITIDAPTAWAVYDGWAENQNGTTWETFETCILKHGDDGWKIAYTSFVQLRHDDTEIDALAVDKDGRLVWASGDTLEKLNQHPILTVSAGRIRARRLDWDRVLQAAIAGAGRYHDFFALRRFEDDTGGPFRYPAVLGDTDEGGVAVVHVSVRDGATRLQLDGGSLDRRLVVAQAVFGLSDGQLRVARHISDGVGLKSAAESIGISINTARTHLARLYEKTGVSSQTALVRLLLSVGR